MIKNKYVAFGIHIAIVIAFLNLLELLYCSFTGNSYQFGVWDNLFLPIVLGVATGYFFYLREKKPKE